MKTVLVTGANGFVGVPVCRALVRAGWRVLGGVRRQTAVVELPTEVQGVLMPDIRETEDWKPSLRGVDTVVHLVARTHVMRDGTQDPLVEYRRINVEGMRRLTDACIATGVRRLVFMSSIKVVGEGGEEPYTETCPLRPQDAYGISKLEAEQLLFRITGGTDTQAVVLRPPLVYGPRVRGNLLRLLKWTRRGLPFPLASIRNRRSLLQVDNLADAVVSAAEHPLAAGEVFHVADDSALSTPELLTALARFQDRPSRLFPCPSYVLRALGRLLGQQGEIHRLTNSLVVSNQRLRRLGWHPRYNTSEGLAEMAHWFQRQTGSVLSPDESGKRRSVPRAA